MLYYFDSYSPMQLLDRILKNVLIFSPVIVFLSIVACLIEIEIQEEETFFRKLRLLANQNSVQETYCSGRIKSYHHDCLLLINFNNYQFDSQEKLNRTDSFKFQGNTFFNLLLFSSTIPSKFSASDNNFSPINSSYWISLLRF